MMLFCTLFDSNYISKGIALYLSIAKHTDDFSMYVLAMDRKCEEMLKELNFPNIIVECIEDNYTEDLQRAKSNRTRAEFCWTCGSFVTHRFLTKYNLPNITYLDSDLMFFSSPQIIFDELEEKNASIGLSPHFIPYNATGKYCVQYCFFKNDKDGLSALTWWKNECINWCYSQIEDGKYGDQMYLSQMPHLFNNVCDIDHRGAGMAYWNEFAYTFRKEGLIHKGLTYKYVFFHYSGFNIKLDGNEIIVKECYPVSDYLRENFVMPYVELIQDVYLNYLNSNVGNIRYIKGYTKSAVVLHKVAYTLMRFDWFHKLKAYLLRRKYTRRRSPYSERNSAK